MLKIYLLVLFLFISCSTSQKLYVQDFVEQPATYGTVEKRAVAAANPYNLQPEIYEQCQDGLPRLGVKTPPGFCLGLAMRDFRFPRGVVSIKNPQNPEQIYIGVIDNGGWWPPRKANGTFYLVKEKNSRNSSKKTYERKSFFFEKLYKPNSVAQGPDNLVYIGLPDRIIRFNPFASQPEKTLENVILNLPGYHNYHRGTNDQGEDNTPRHPLNAFAFDSEGNIFVNVGSESDNCSQSALAESCPEAEGTATKPARGVVRKYLRENNSYTRWSVYSKGLRNSMAIFIHPETQEVFQVENGRDGIGMASDIYNTDEYPKEELNILESGEHYGWPYCFDNNLNSPEFPDYNCNNATEPFLYLPAHSSPLGMIMYTGDLFPATYKNNLMITYHGYHAINGHKLVHFEMDENFRPKKDQKELIYKWGETNNHSKGSPMGITEASDGSLYLTDDKNKMLLRLSYDIRNKDINDLVDEEFNTTAESRKCSLSKEKEDEFSSIQSNITQTCMGCHGTAIRNSNYFVDACSFSEAKDFDQLINHPVKPMPPVGQEGEFTEILKDQVKEWINYMSEEENKVYEIINADTLNIRIGSGINFNTCATISKGTKVKVLSSKINNYVQIQTLYKDPEVAKNCPAKYYVHADYVKKANFD